MRWSGWVWLIAECGKSWGYLRHPLDLWPGTHLWKSQRCGKELLGQSETNHWSESRRERSVFYNVLQCHNAVISTTCPLSVHCHCQVLTSAETDGVILHPRHLFEVIFDLVQRGHSEGMTAVSAAIFSLIWSSPVNGLNSCGKDLLYSCTRSAAVFVCIVHWSNDWRNGSCLGHRSPFGFRVSRQQVVLSMPIF